MDVLLQPQSPSTVQLEAHPTAKAYGKRPVNRTAIAQPIARIWFLSEKVQGMVMVRFQIQI